MLTRLFRWVAYALRPTPHTPARTHTRTFPSLSLILLFLLPLQTRLIVWRPMVGTSESEFGVLSVYATAVLALLIVVMRLLRGGALSRGALVAVGSVCASVAITFAVPTLFGAVMVQILSVLAVISAVYPVLQEHPRKAICALGAGLGVSFVLALVQMLSGGSGAVTLLGLAVRDAQNAGDAVFLLGGERVLRAYGFFPHPNIFGAVLAMCGAIVLTFQHTHKSIYVFMGIFAVGIACTLSRGAGLALVLAGVAALLVAYKRGAWTMMLFAIPVLAWLMQGQGSFFAFRGAELETQSHAERVAQFGEWGSVVREHGLVGTGLGGYSTALAHLDGDAQPAWAYQPVHNVFLLLFAEWGLVGIGVVVGTFVALSRIFKDTQRPIPALTHTLALILPTPIFIALWSLLWFDHFLWTSWAGMVYACLALAFLFTKR